MEHSGLFLVLEGVEGSGKTTQCRMLHERLKSHGVESRLIREPGGTPVGEGIRGMLQTDDSITPLAELYLFNAARAALVECVVRPALERGEAVVSDRYIYSTIAYQGYGRQLPLDEVSTLCRIATGALSADLVVLLDLSPEQGFDRMAGRRLDRIESEERDFHERVRGGYLHQARQDPERWQVVDASAAPEAISDSIWDRVQQKLMNRGLLK